MKHVYCLSLLLLAPLLICAQDPAPNSFCRLTSKYDRFAEVSTVQCDVIDLDEAPAKLTVQANASFSKTSTKGRARFWLYLSSNRGGVTRRTRPLFQQARTLCLRFDGAQLEFPVLGYRHTFYELIPACAESARVEIGRDDLGKLLAAERLTGCWGDVEFQFSQSALASLKDFISHQVFASNTP